MNVKTEQQANAALATQAERLAAERARWLAVLGPKPKSK